jgi:pimeloyl-ACP methyl ester carboxylesterase
MTNQLTWCCFLLLTFAVPAANTAFSQQAIDDPQSWTGTLDVGAAKLRLRFDIQKDDDGKLKCTMMSLDQGKTKVTMDSCKIDAGKLVIRSDRLKLVYEGTYKNTEIEGTFTQGGQSFNLKLKAAKPATPTRHVETWQGTMKAGGREFEFQFRVLETKDKKRQVELDSFSESIGGLHVEPTFNDDGVVFVVALTKAKFEGKYNQDKTQLDGHWLQGGGKFPLNLKKVSLADTRPVKPPKRPQTPKQPVSYNSKEVTFDNTSANVSLSGTLTTPRTKGPFAAVVLITGSGPQDRDESLLEHKPFLVLADHLTKAGIAVLRYDERGVGNSTGDFSGATSEDLSLDVEAAINYLKTQPDIDDRQIGLIGHSEGGYIAPMVAARRDDVEFIVMLAGTGLPGDQIIMNQSEKIGRAAGSSDSDLDLTRRFQDVMFGTIRSASGKDVEKTLVKKIDEFIETLSDEEKQHEVVKNSKAAVAKMTDPWFLFFLTYDPRPVLTSVKCPVLVLNGANDLQVDPQLNLPEIRKALTTGGNTQFEIHELPDLNHLFQTSKTGSPSEYRQIEETFSPVALEIISKWIIDRTK